MLSVRMSGLSGLVENKGAVKLGTIPSTNAPTTTIFVPCAHTGTVSGEKYVYVANNGEVCVALGSASGVNQVMFQAVWTR